MLDLSFNNIESASFEGLISLRTLRLSYNHINRMSSFNNTDLMNLETLDLAHNDLTNFTDAELDATHGSFAAMKKLKVFDIGYNKFISIDVRPISHLFHQLNGLFLQGNNITTIDDEIEKLLPDLVDLGISNNNFSCDWLDSFLESFKLDLLRKVIGAIPVDPNKVAIFGIACNENESNGDGDDVVKI